MPTVDWLKKEFFYGYDSGDVLAWFPDKQRKSEEGAIGGSYRKLFYSSIGKYLQKDSKVLELGPGRGSWTRAVLKQIPKGEIHTVDFQDLKQYLKPELYDGRLQCHQVNDNSFNCVADSYFDIFWSFGVLCHNNQDNIKTILSNALNKVKLGGIAVHQYGDWDKLEKYGWGEKSHIPADFKNKPDEEIWWPRNSQSDMRKIAEQSGWEIISIDLDLVKRDSICVLRRKQS